MHIKTKGLSVAGKTRQLTKRSIKLLKSGVPHMISVEDKSVDEKQKKKNKKAAPKVKMGNVANKRSRSKADMN